MSQFQAFQSKFCNSCLITVDRASTDYLATTQDGIFAQIEIDKQRFTQGKTDLDLQFEQGAISADLYTAKLKQLGLETNTLRNAIQPLRTATTGFFSDIFAGQGVFDGLGNALRNLTVNILKNFQDLISKQLGQQLFGSLAAGAGESSGGSGAISNAISVTIQNNGQAKETSRGDANAIANLVRNLVTEGLINERRPGGLLS